MAQLAENPYILSSSGGRGDRVCVGGDRGIHFALNASGHFGYETSIDSPEKEGRHGSTGI